MLEGVLLRREAVALGISDKTLHRLVREKVWTRIRQGAYADTPHWNRSDRVQRHELLTAAIVRLYGPDTLISYQSAVVDHGVASWGLALDHVHISYSGANGRTQAAVKHHDAGRRSDDLPRDGGGWVRSPARAVVESTMDTGSIEVGVCMASHLLRKELTCSEQLWAAHDDVADQAGSLIVRTVLALSDGKLESVGECRLWYLLRRSGLPDIIPQLQVRDLDGELLGRVDFAIPELGVIIEFNGLEKYAKYRKPGETVADAVLAERRREVDIQTATGWQIVRIVWADLDHPERIIAQIRAAARRVRG